MKENDFKCRQSRRRCRRKEVFIWKKKPEEEEEGELKRERNYVRGGEKEDVKERKWGERKRRGQVQRQSRWRGEKKVREGKRE